MEYTKGEWKVLGELEVETDGYRYFGEPKRKDWFVVGTINGKTDRIIAEIGGWADRPNAKDDARLISAAPDMYEVCKKALLILNYMTTQDFQTGKDRYVRHLLEHAITKAEGVINDK